jgi:hypothetical protein
MISSDGGYLVPHSFLSEMLGRFYVVPGEGWLWDRWRVYGDDGAGGLVIARFTRSKSAWTVAHRLNYFLYLNREKLLSWYGADAVRGKADGR